MRRSSAGLFAFALFVSAAGLPAQCALTWTTHPVSSLPDLLLGHLVNGATTWDPDLGGPLPPRLAIGGFFRQVEGVPISGVASYDEATDQWFAFGAGRDYEVIGIASNDTGLLVVGGLDTDPSFSIIGPVDVWDGSSWQSLPPMNGPVFSVAVLPNLDIVVGGQFSSATDGTLVSNIARWDGANWRAMGGGALGLVRALEVQSNGDLIANGGFALGGPPVQLARWNGTAWTGVDVGGTTQSIGTLSFQTMANGNIVASGGFFAPGGAVEPVAVWDGSDWQPIPNGPNGPVTAVTELPTGEIVVAGQFDSAGGVAADLIARWDGTGWSAIGPGFGSIPTRQLFDLEVTPSGSLWAVGYFPETCVLPAPFVAGQCPGDVVRMTSACPAAATVLGTPGAGPGGPVTLSPRAQPYPSLPYIGGALDVRGVGFASQSLVITVLGFAPLPAPLTLATVFPQALPGNELLITPDLLDIQLAFGGLLDVRVPLPFDPALASAQLFAQMVGIEFDAVGAFVAITATNGIAATLGAY